jgi:hypothetical protein
MRVFVDTTVNRGRGNARSKLLLYLLVVAFLNGCAFVGSPSRPNKAWLLDGALALSRPVPTPTKQLADNSAASATSPTTVTAEAPTADQSTVPSILISRQDKTLTALRPGETPLVLKTEGAQFLKEGSFSVTQKKENPLWYAPNRYFTNRSLTIPQEGSRDRFKRAALGSRTLFLNDQTPIHSGPVWMKEIGGLRVKPAEMAQIYTMIAVGTRVEVR